jgi:hypothetical protein
MKETVMLRYSSSALLLALSLVAAGCSEGNTDSPFVSEAVAAPAAQTPDYGWRTEMAADAQERGDVKDYY